MSDCVLFCNETFNLTLRCASHALDVLKPLNASLSIVPLCSGEINLLTTCSKPLSSKAYRTSISNSELLWWQLFLNTYILWVASNLVLLPLYDQVYIWILVHYLWKNWVLFEHKRIKLWNKERFVDNKTEIVQHVLKMQ